jgi:hypothetical protein
VHEHFALHSDQVVNDAPSVATTPLGHLRLQLLQLRGGRNLGAGESKTANVGDESAASSDPSLVSQWDNASATMLVEPDWYSTRKSKPISLLAHWC